MRTPTLLFLSFILSSALAAAEKHPIPAPFKEPPPSAFECRWAEGPITLDGAADEPAWKNADTIEAFHIAWAKDGGRMARTATKAKLLWDREYLYFFSEMEDSDLFADVTEHDGNTWNNDVFELFFKPAADKTGYYEFQVNAAGTVFDAFFPKRNFDTIMAQKKVGDFHLEAKRKLRGTLKKRDDADEGWSVEGRIPWTDFLRTGGRPDVGESWAMNLCRYDYHTEWPKPELSCVAPVKVPKVGSHFHQYEDYATLKFVGSKTAVPPKLTQRVPLTTSTVVGWPEPPLYRTERIYPNYRPDTPVAVGHIPGTDQMMLLHQAKGNPTVLTRFKDDPAVTEKDAVKLMDTPDAGVATDFTFHPKFRENGFVYIGWNSKIPGRDDKPGMGSGKMNRITRYTMKPTPPYDFDAESGKTIIEWESNGHNGLAVCFGHDGMLYVTTGDGTSDSDTNVTGQRIDLLLAKVLRLDVDHPAEGKLYTVPKDNPFVGDKRYAPETWAYGMRNPWRITCDSKSGRIWVGSNGQDLWEYAHLLKKGANYGWSVMEGSHPFYLERKLGPDPLVPPEVEHSHAEFRSLTGGMVYHGSKTPELDGVYIYGDYATGRIWGIQHDGTKTIWNKELAISPLKLTCFAANGAGDLVICDHSKQKDDGGGFYTLVPMPKDDKPNIFPRKLSDSGLFDSVKGHKVKPGVIPYSVNTSFWSDGMYKERFIAVPGEEKVEFNRGRSWNFPDRSVLVKSFAVEEKEGDPASRKWIETRFMTKQQGEWYGYTYLWNDEGTDADLVPAKGTDREFTIRTAKGERKQTWHYPGRGECMACHSRAANFVLGLSEVQMNKDQDYGGCVENQVQVLDRIGLLKGVNWPVLARDAVVGAAKENGYQVNQRAITGEHVIGLPGVLKKLADAYDPKADLTARARAWLHVNCSTCHVESGGGNAQMTLRWDTADDKMKVFNEPPVHTSFNLPDAKIIAPGHPERSIMLHRIGLRGPGQMPPLATARIDEEALAMMREWVKSLKKE